MNILLEHVEIEKIQVLKNLGEQLLHKIDIKGRITVIC
jgi:hypothetical protein